MIVPRLATVDTAVQPPARTERGPNESIDGQVQSALNLHLPLKSPMQMPALVKLLQERRSDVDDALSALNYVHFARFLPAPDGSALWVLTVYDGDLEPYILDFVVKLGDVFTEALYFIRDAPPLPVQRYPREFIAFVKKNNLPVGDWSAYPERTVIAIRRKFEQS